MRNYPDKWKTLNTILSHDWLTGMRGGERVLEILCEGFPNAPLFTLIHNPAAISNTINRHAITVSWLQNVPGIMKNYRYFLPFFPAAISRFQTPPADLLISASHCVAKGLPHKPGTKHLCYCFTPMRYAWTFRDEYFGRSLLKSLLVSPILASLRRWDRDVSAGVDLFVAISRHVQKRIRDFYGREADVVYPPVDTDAFTPGGGAAGSYDLVVSALVPYKRIDLAIRAYNKLAFPLKIIGSGTDTSKLRKLAGPSVDFLGWQADDKLVDLYRNCRQLVFPGEEDFGIVPLEAQACGKPVVAYRKGGVLETVVENVTGIFFDEQTEQSLAEAVQKCAVTKWDPAAARSNAEKFSVPNFIASLAASIEKCLGR